MGRGSGRLGQADVGVAEAGFGSYVKTYKPWFIGRQAYLDREKARKGVIARFRFTEKGVRMAHPGDPILDKRGKVVGFITSCAIDREGLMTGQTFVDMKNSQEGTILYVFQGATYQAEKASAELLLADKITLPSPVQVVSRFMK
jgi:glycine hydroxymethyltransferase